MARRQNRSVLEDGVRAAIETLRAYGAVAVVGAGVSSSRLPRTGLIAPLVWQAIDAHPDARDALRSALAGGGATTKDLVGTDEAKMVQAWRVIEEFPGVRASFQEAFARLDLDRDPTPAHYALARLIRAGVVELVISFNWDTLLERAHEQLYGTRLIGAPERLIKPHGNAATPEEQWVLPHQAGFVPSVLSARMASLKADRPRVLLVIGYSGSDPTVVEHLLSPAEHHWPVVRISPTASGEGSLPGPADDILTALANQIGAPRGPTGWRWVTFSRRRDLSAALRGYRLGPQDVVACPVLPGSDRALERIRTGQVALLSGSSGAGKSLAAFQAAYALSREGWAVLELAQPGIAGNETVQALVDTRGPVVAVVDDAQAIELPIRWALERAASADHAVILTVTEVAIGPEQVRLSGAEAVAALAAFCRDRRAEVEPLVRALDDRIGPALLDTSFDLRVQDATTADYPWQFMHVLAGGDRRIAESIANLPTADADLLVGLVAAAQLASADAGATRETLMILARALGHDGEWLDAGLAVLAGDRLLVERGGRLRLPHARSAGKALVELLRDPSAPRFGRLIEIMRSVLHDDAQPLQGLLWLLRAIDGLDVIRLPSRAPRVLEDVTADRVVRRCLDAPMGRDRNVAAYLVWEIDWLHALTPTSANAVASRMPGWIREVTADDVYGVSWLLSGLRSDTPSRIAAISADVDPEAIAARLADHGTPESGEEWARLLLDLARAHPIGIEAWRGRFAAALDVPRIATWAARDGSPYGSRGVIELTEALVGLAPDMAAVMVVAIAPALRRRLESDLAGASRDLTPWAFGVFPTVELARENPEDKRDLAAFVKAIVEFVSSVDWRAAGASLSGVHLSFMDQLLSLTLSIASLDPDAFARLASGLDFEALDRAASGHWQDFRLLREPVVALSFGDNREPARSWVISHADEITDLPTSVIPIAPEVVVTMLAKGLAVQLDPADGLWWSQCAEALKALRTVSLEAAAAVARASVPPCAAGLALRQSNMIGGLDTLIEELDAIDPGLTDACIDAIDLESARLHWPQRLSGTDAERSAVSLLLRRAETRPGPIGHLAQELLTES
jgi:hypothetical protein